MTRATQRKAKKGQKGFTLIELMVILTVVMLLGAYGLQKEMRAQNEQQAKAAGEQLSRVAIAANAFMLNHYQEIAGQAAVADTDPATRLNCAPQPPSGTFPVPDASVYRCTVPFAALQKEGWLDMAEQNITPFTSGAGGWTIQFRATPAGTTTWSGAAATVWQPEGIVIANGDWMADTAANAVLRATTAAKEAGFDGGVAQAGVFKGLGGSTTAPGSITSANYSAINSAYKAQLGARVGVGSGFLANYVRRDGTLPMRANLHMGGNSIVNIHSVEGDVNSSLRMLSRAFAGVTTPPSLTIQKDVGSGVISTMMAFDTNGNLLLPQTEARAAATRPSSWAADSLALSAQHILATAIGVGGQGDVDIGTAAAADPAATLTVATVAGQQVGEAKGASLEARTINSSNSTVGNMAPGLIFGATADASAWRGSAAGVTASTYVPGDSTRSKGGFVSVDDIYIRRLGRWASEMASNNIWKATTFVTTSNPASLQVRKPTCPALKSGGAAGTPQLVVSQGDQIASSMLKTAGYVWTGYVWLAVPAPFTMDNNDRVSDPSNAPLTGNFITGRADNYFGNYDMGTYWQLYLYESGTWRQGYTAIAQAYCTYPFNP